MKNLFIIHGSDGHSKENWFPWMKQQLESQGFECIVPDFPCEDGHQLNRWYAELEKYKDKISKETVFMAHSRGVSFVLNLLTDYDFRIDSLYMVGGFIKYLWEKDGVDTFFAIPFDYKKIKKQCNRFVNYQSDDDPWVPLEHGKSITGLLNARFELVSKAGHFNTEVGYTEFQVLLDDIIQSSDNKSRIVRENIDGYNYFMNTLDILTTEEIECKNILGEWGIKEIIAHLSGWETIVMKEIDQILENKLPVTVGISDKEVDKINIEEVNKRSHLNFEETLDEWKETFEKLHNKLEELREEDYVKVVKEGDKSTSIKEIFDYRYEGLDHTSAHARQVRNFFKK